MMTELIAGALFLVLTVGFFAFLVAMLIHASPDIADANGQDALDREVEQMFNADGFGVHPPKGGDPSRTPD